MGDGAPPRAGDRSSSRLPLGSCLGRLQLGVRQLLFASVASVRLCVWLGSARTKRHSSLLVCRTQNRSSSRSAARDRPAAPPCCMLRHTTSQLTDHHARCLGMIHQGIETKSLIHHPDAPRKAAPSSSRVSAGSHLARSRQCARPAPARCHRPRPHRRMVQVLWILERPVTH